MSYTHCTMNVSVINYRASAVVNNQNNETRMPACKPTITQVQHDKTPTLLLNYNGKRVIQDVDIVQVYVCKQFIKYQSYNMYTYNIIYTHTIYVQYTTCACIYNAYYICTIILYQDQKKETLDVVKHKRKYMTIPFMVNERGKQQPTQTDAFMITANKQ